MSLSDKIDFFPIEHTTYQKTLPQLSKTVPSNFGWHADKYLPLEHENSDSLSDTFAKLMLHRILLKEQSTHTMMIF